MDEPQQLTMSEKEAAARLGVGPDWLAQQGRQRDVPFIQFGRSRRYTEEHLLQIIAHRENPCTDPWARSPRSQARREREDQKSALSIAAKRTGLSEGSVRAKQREAKPRTW